MTQAKITCSACSHAFTVPPNARTAICPRCGQALPVFFGSIEPTGMPAKKSLPGTSGEEGDASGAQLARIKLKKRPVKKPPPLPKMPPPPPPDPLTASHPMDSVRPDLPASAPPTIPQMMTDMPEAPGSFVGSPQFSKVPEFSTPVDPDGVDVDEATYQMDGPPWLEPGMDEMTGPDLPRRIKGPPIDLAQFTPTSPPAHPPVDVPPPEDRSLIATKAGALRQSAGIVPPPPLPGAGPGDLPGPPALPPPADLSDFDGDLPGPPVAAVAPVIEPPMQLPGDDIDQRLTRSAKPPLGPPPADPLVHLPTEFEMEVAGDNSPPPMRPESDSYYDVSQSDRVAALDAAITDAIEPGPTRAAVPDLPQAAPHAYVPPPPGPVPPRQPPEMLSDPPTPYGPAPSSVLPVDDYQPLPGAVPPARPLTQQLGSQPPPAAPLAVPMADYADSAPENLGDTGITVLVPDRPIQEVHAGQQPPSPKASADVEAEILEAPPELLSPRQTRQRSAAGHGVAMKGAVAKAEHRKSRLTMLLIIAGVSVVVGVGGLVAFLVLR